MAMGCLHTRFGYVCVCVCMARFLFNAINFFFKNFLMFLWTLSSAGQLQLLSEPRYRERERERERLGKVENIFPYSAVTGSSSSFLKGWRSQQSLEWSLINGFLFSARGVFCFCSFSSFPFISLTGSKLIKMRLTNS